MATDIETDPQQEKAERIKNLQGHVEMLLALAERPALFDQGAWEAADADLRLFLKQEFERHHTDPEARPTNNWYRENVSRLSDGDLECDENALVSRGDENGAYVQTWAWVPGPECADCDKPMPDDKIKRCPECQELEDECQREMRA